MKPIRLLTLALILALAAVALTACGNSDDSLKKKSSSNDDLLIPTAVPTNTPTPTEAPKSPEQKDLDVLLSIMEAAEKHAAKKKYTFNDTTSFLIKVDEGKIELEIDPIKTYQMRLRDDWISNTPTGKREYTLQSEEYSSTCRYATIIGVIEEDGTVSWTANNLAPDVYAAVSGHGVKWDPEYLQRAELYEEIKGNWSGIIQWPFDVLIDLFVDVNDTEAVETYHNLIAFLKKSGFSGNLTIAVGCSIRSVKELAVTMQIDWSEFVKALEKATSTREGMTKFLCICTGVDETTLKYVLKQQGTDIATFGAESVAMMKRLCDDNAASISTSPYTYNDNVLTIKEANRNVDRLTYDKENHTLTYRDIGMACVLRKE